MKKIIYTSLFILSAILFSACQQSSIYEGLPEETNDEIVDGNTDEVVDPVEFTTSQKEVPTLAVIMNWNNYSENDPLIWYNKLFNKDKNSVNRWYYDSTDANIEFVPISESSGTANDGIIMVDMGKNHPGGSNDTSFRNTEIRNAITSSVVDSHVDFASYDTNKDGTISRTELQIIFIVAGGEQSYGDSVSKSIWAHAWAFDSSNAPEVDGVSLMKAAANPSLSGSYMRFGATHGIDTADAHKAVIGIISHELGHALLKLVDLYDNDGGGSGLGYYDIMSSGSWARKTTDTYDGQTPVQFSAYSKILSQIDVNTTEINSTIATAQTVTIKCSSNSLIKLNTTQSNEYFLLECRDTAKSDSDKSFEHLDSAFTDNKLVSFIYHVDTDKPTDSSKLPNNESGTQKASNHYMLSLIERDTTNALTSTEDVKAYLSDGYTDGYTIDSTKTKTYDGASGYIIKVESSNYTDRTMTFKISK